MDYAHDCTCNHKFRHITGNIRFFLSFFCICAGAFSHYEQYNQIWLLNKEEAINEFLQDNPTLDEFEQQIISYKEIEERVKMEEEKKNVGSVCLLTGKERNAFGSINVIILISFSGGTSVNICAFQK